MTKYVNQIKISVAFDMLQIRPSPYLTNSKNLLITYMLLATPKTFNWLRVNRDNHVFNSTSNQHL